MAVKRMESCEDVGELAKELGVTRRCLYKRRSKLDLLEPGEESVRPSTHEGSYRKQADRLKRLALDQNVPYANPNFRWFKARYQSFVCIDRVIVAADQRGRGLASMLYRDLILKSIEAIQPR